MQGAIHDEVLEPAISLTSIVSAARMLPALDKLRLIRILAEDLEEAAAELSWLGCMTDTGQIVGVISPAESMEAWEVLAH